jgi:hypothetical protein
VVDVDTSVTFMRKVIKHVYSTVPAGAQQEYVLIAECVSLVLPPFQKIRLTFFLESQTK